MATDKRVAIWSSAPAGSRIRIFVKGTTQKKLVTAHAQVLPADSPQRRLTDDDLQPGPAEIVLDESHYTVRLFLQYVTAGTAEVTAEVIGNGQPIPPDGSTEPQFKSILSDAQGQTLAVTFVVVRN